jgi:hypothetical protein
MPGGSYCDLLEQVRRSELTFESLIHEDFERCHPGHTLESLKRRHHVPKKIGDCLRDWMTIAASGPPLVSQGVA